MRLQCKVAKLNDIAAERGQTLAEMSLSWLLKDSKVTSVIVGASSVEQLADNINALKNTSFDDVELQRTNEILK